MSKLKIFYILSLLVLVVLVAFTIFRPMLTGEKFSEVERAQLLKKEDEWIVQFDITNHEGQGQNYVIKVNVDNQQYYESVFIPDGKIFTYIYHCYPEQMTKNEVTFLVYKGEEAAPFEKATYHLD